ncbi:putative selenate ABC transporter substrate-binding protein [Pseudonocardia sp.]|uniref:putative selenate ABC transporter substrate-binding protein n=1 Tax=Pseudonocardia sp. TaxID=60912 RepID=UPI002634C7C0|nr:putative selenate ABC transporter substrate-binding protein [Pseudonocardia sp.]
MRRTHLAAALAALAVVATACGGAAEPADRELVISAIPDQDPEKLQRLYGEVSSYLGEQLGVTVVYQPVTDYTASVTSFRRGDVDATFFGGLSGVQARLQVPGSVLLAQRDIDENFRSVFVASPAAGIAPIADVAGLSVLRERTLTFGSEVSTSGRLMPQFFLDQAGVTPAELAGDPGFSGSHDATIALVEAGTYQVGALSASVWDARVADGSADPAAVVEIFRTPSYHDYHWLGSPDLDADFGAGFTERLRTALLRLDGSDQRETDILELFTAGAFVPTVAENYTDIETVARGLGLLQ